ATGKVAGIGELAVAFNLAAVLLMSAWRVTTGHLEPGQLVAIVGIAVYLSEPIRLLSNSMSDAAVAHGAARRVSDFLNARTVFDDKDQQIDIAGSALTVADPAAVTLPETHDHALIAPHSADIFEGTLRSNIAMTLEPDAPVDVEVLEASGVAEIIEALRSEEHTSELQSRFDLVCRLLLETNK